MRTVLTLAMAMALSIVHAQLSLRPAELVEAQKSTRAKFVKYQLFDRAPNLRDADAVNAQWLSLRSEDLRGLLQARPKAMTFPIPAGDAGIYELELVQENPEQVVRELATTVAQLPIGHIKTNAGQPRKNFSKESLEELASSIRASSKSAFGIITMALTCLP